MGRALYVVLCGIALAHTNMGAETLCKGQDNASVFRVIPDVLYLGSGRQDKLDVYLPATGSNAVAPAVVYVDPPCRQFPDTNLSAANAGQDAASVRLSRRGDTYSAEYLRQR
jgi:hypothetical protein